MLRTFRMAFSRSTITLLMRKRSAGFIFLRRLAPRRRDGLGRRQSGRAFQKCSTSRGARPGQALARGLEPRPDVFRFRMLGDDLWGAVERRPESLQQRD